MHATAFRPCFRILMFVLLLVSLLWLPAQVFSQDFYGASVADQYSQQELAQMLAPIALYPDALLAQILMASTYPLEVIEADRWFKRHSNLDEDAIDDALYDQEWDPSVKSLCHFPATLARMSEQISETTNLGNAFLAQENAVMETVQKLRAKAYTAGNLYTNAQQRVVVEHETIIIQPVRPRVIYVPYYDPYSIYGSWWYPDYPPYYWGPSGVRLGLGLAYNSGIYFSFGFGSWSSFDWQQHTLYIDARQRPRFVRREHFVNSGAWQHQSSHRRGVAYRDKRTAQKYGQASQRYQDVRRESRGFSDERTSVQLEPRSENNVRKTAAVMGFDPRKEQKKQVEQKHRLEQKQKPGARKSSEQASERAVLKQQLPSRNAHSAQNERSTADSRQRQPRSPAKRERASEPQALTEDQLMRPRDSVFSRVESGKDERRSSKRGKASRREELKQEQNRHHK